MKSPVLVTVAIAGTMLLLIQNTAADDTKRNAQSDRYVINQTFDRQSFFKDNNIWIYNASFAEVFGMPSEAVYPNLKGIEAAAFRLEDANYKLCGMGGKAENCIAVNRCVVDVYIDERKFPLPWATDQKVDWLNDYNSLLWLQLPPKQKTPDEIALDNEMGSNTFRTNQGGRVSEVPEGIIPSIMTKGMFTLHPFGDLISKREVNWYSDSGTRVIGSISAPVQIYGFKRQAINQLTLLSLGCRGRSQDRVGTSSGFYLESRKNISKEGFFKRFYEFELPDVFEQKIDAALRAKTERDAAYYKPLLDSMSNR